MERVKVMKYFENYTSNTYAGTGNQTYLKLEKGEMRTSRAFYKISVGGEYNYSFLFSNIIDSTFADGSKSRKNLICDEYIIHNARVGICDRVEVEYVPEDMEFVDLSFNGNHTKKVMPGEFFSTDPIKLSAEKNQYVCIELVFSGEMIPYHAESCVHMFIKTENGWRYSNDMPTVGMLGCDRWVEKRICYLGDSITQGIGVEINSYNHWAAKVSEMLGEDYAFWDIGIGYGRAEDVASNGAWLFKAKQNDIVVVCYGVNDIMQNRSAEQIKADLAYIIDKLKEENITVAIQTIPPFDYKGEKIDIWNSVNEHIKNELSRKADMVFDIVPYLAQSKENPHLTKYGDHPNEEGCKAWAEALYPHLKQLIENSK